MRFAFGDDQLALGATVRQVLGRECTPADLRAVAAGTTDPRRWRVLAELGAPGLAVDEDLGGLGLDEVALVVVLEEVGRVALPEPLAETAALAAPALTGVAATAGPGAGRAIEALRAIAAGGLVVGVGGVGIGDAGEASTTTVPGDDASARTERVVGASAAGMLLLCTRSEAAGWEVHAVDAADAVVDPTPSIDPTRDLSTVVWRPSTQTLLADGGAGAALVHGLCAHGALSTAAQLLGLADRLLASATGYANERVQFGRPIGSFQAVKHHLADVRVRLDFARPVTYRAADSLRRDLPAAPVHVSMAKSLASDAADLAARVALQVHGAIGYTWEADLHLYMKRAWALSATWGDARAHRARVLEAAVALDGARPPW